MRGGGGEFSEKTNRCTFGLGGGGSKNFGSQKNDRKRGPLGVFFESPRFPTPHEPMVKRHKTYAIDPNDLHLFTHSSTLLAKYRPYTEPSGTVPCSYFLPVCSSYTANSFGKLPWPNAFFLMQLQRDVQVMIRLNINGLIGGKRCA